MNKSRYMRRNKQPLKLATQKSNMHEGGLIVRTEENDTSSDSETAASET